VLAQFPSYFLELSCRGCLAPVAVAVARGATEMPDEPALVSESNDDARRRLLLEGDCGCERGEAEAALGTREERRADGEADAMGVARGDATLRPGRGEAVGADLGVPAGLLLLSSERVLRIMDGDWEPAKVEERLGEAGTVCLGAIGLVMMGATAGMLA
jgi:hypothetical protein